jgi:hypothetical protein
MFSMILFADFKPLEQKFISTGAAPNESMSSFASSYSSEFMPLLCF